MCKRQQAKEIVLGKRNFKKKEIFMPIIKKPY
jgi:hypothetical protein